MFTVSLPGTPVTKSALDALNVLYTDTNQTVTGTKTFSALPRSSVNPVSDDELTRRGWVLSQIATATGTLDWQDSVLDKDLNSPPPGPTVGDRYIVASPGGGDWAGHDNEIAEWDGSAWVFTTPSEGFACEVEDENRIYIYVPTSWVTLGSVIDHGSLQGLGLDHHTQYVLVDGTRAFTGNVNVGSHDITSIQNLYMDAPSATSGKVYMGGTIFMRNYGGNMAIGNNAGNDTMTGTENTLVGIQTGWAITTGNQNIYIGSKCGDASTTGNMNVAVGAYALSGAFTGDYNSVLGTGAMYAFTTGNNNVAIGGGAMAYATGSDNVAIGYYAGRIANGNGNVYIGNHAGRYATGDNKLYIANTASDPPLIYGDFSLGRIGLGTTSPAERLHVAGNIQVSEDAFIGLGATAGRIVFDGSASMVSILGCDTTVQNLYIPNNTYRFYAGTTYFLHLTNNNTGLGLNAMNASITGTGNTIIGNGAGASMTTGDQNTAVGHSALNSATSSNSNTAIGAYACRDITNGFNNTVVGNNALLVSTSGSYNVAIGKAALELNTASYNVAIGYQAGRNSTSSNSVFIGYRAGRNATANNVLYIANSDIDPPLIFGDFANGRIGLGTTSPTQTLDVNSDTIRIRSPRTPASASDPGYQGDICWDTNYIYVCVAPNTWKRAELSTW